MSVLLSIKPKYVNAILNGAKEYEFRKVIFRKRIAQRVYVYASAPVKKVVGFFTVGEIIEDHPVRIWERCRNKSGIEKDEFFAYFRGCEKGYAIKISDLRIFRVPIDPRTFCPDFVPPQSFCYFDVPKIGGSRYDA